MRAPSSNAGIARRRGRCQSGCLSYGKSSGPIRARLDRSDMFSYHARQVARAQRGIARTACVPRAAGHRVFAEREHGQTPVPSPIGRLERRAGSRRFRRHLSRYRATRQARSTGIISLAAVGLKPRRNAISRGQIIAVVRGRQARVEARLFLPTPPQVAPSRTLRVTGSDELSGLKKLCYLELRQDDGVRLRVPPGLMTPTG